MKQIIQYIGLVCIAIFLMSAAIQSEFITIKPATPKYVAVLIFDDVNYHKDFAKELRSYLQKGYVVTSTERAGHTGYMVVYILSKY